MRKLPAELLFPCVTTLALAWQGGERGAPPTTPPSLGTVEVPLVRMPGVTNVGGTAGVAFLDYDADGWIDLYVNTNAGLWHNEGGLTFTRVADLDDFLPPRGDRYGASCGDFDNDGLPDIACEPRGDCLYLLKNLDGAGHFLEIGSDPALMIDPATCGMYAETFCWADVDEDGDLDLWATAYPDSVQAGSGGDQFFENLGASGPGGAYRFANRTSASGLGIPANVSRPEGAQFADLDRDGDLDAFANGTLYQNVTGSDGPRFHALVRAPTGISLNRLDEGVTIFDYDLDGDEDVFVLYKGLGNRIWENEGDGTFFYAEGAIDDPGEGSTEGCSAEDWDLDGDLDLTTGHIFRRNLLVESGERFLRIATHAIADSYLDFPTPAWGDWDKDGDVDCMLANWRGQGFFFQNTSYDPSTPALAKRAVRVRPVRDSALAPRGLETEFGAEIEVRVHGDASGFVRRRTVSSSQGYLQQSEYAQTFALPAGPDPEQAASGLVFDLLVDFPSLPQNGLQRIDRRVNPVLGALELAALAEREITVYRSGLVRIDGVDYAPRGPFSARLETTGQLILPALGQPTPPAPLSAPEPGWCVGMELATHETALWIDELVLDGQLAPAGTARCDANVRLWDVTDAASALLVRHENRATSARNDRSFLPLAWLLKPARVYRVLCRVSELRSSPHAPVPGATLEVHGALSFADPEPCEPAALLAAPLLPGQAFLALRYRSASPTADKDSRR